MSINIVCSGPGPHTPASGVLGTADIQVTGMLCSSAACQAATVAAATATAASAVNTGALQTALDLRLAQIEGFIAANPGGAVLTAGQTLIVAKMLAGLTRLARNAVSSTGQAS